MTPPAITTDASTRTPPTSFVAWERVPGGRSRGKWRQVATGATEAEALGKAQANPRGLKHRDLTVLPNGLEP
jgi:hypothetical protein